MQDESVARSAVEKLVSEALTHTEQEEVASTY